MLVVKKLERSYFGGFPNWGPDPPVFFAFFGDPNKENPPKSKGFLFAEILGKRRKDAQEKRGKPENHKKKGNRRKQGLGDRGFPTFFRERSGLCRRPFRDCLSGAVTGRERKGEKKGQKRKENKKKDEL